MSCNRFELILQAIKYTDHEPPVYQYRFHQVRQLIEEWNDNMTENFTPSWVNCLNESMSFWVNMNTRPGFIYCPRKPWPFGNEYHTMCCCQSGVMFNLELAKGKDQPRDAPPVPYNEHKTTARLLLQMSKQLYNTGKVVILDSGICVLKGIVELQ